MLIEVSNTLTVENPTPEMVLWCKRNLTIPNPDYAKKSRMNLWLGNTPKVLSLYETRGTTLVLPFGTLRLLPKDISDKALFLSEFAAPVEVNYNADVPLYDYQETAVQAMVAAKYGILQSAAGSGKTQMGIALAARLGRRTLWLCHTLDLIKQSKERAKVAAVEQWWADYVDTGISPEYDEKKDAEILAALRTNTLSPETDIEALIAEAEGLKKELDEISASTADKEKRLKTINDIIKEHAMGQFRDGDKKVEVKGFTYVWTVSRSETTEVLNRFQLASVMHSSIVSGMAQFSGYWQSMSRDIVTCANGIINAVVVSTAGINENLVLASASGYDPYNSLAQTVYEDSKKSYDGAYSDDSWSRNMREFYHEYVEPTLKEIATDTKRQADKKEQTIVKVGNRTINDAVTTQKEANGFSFTE